MSSGGSPAWAASRGPSPVVPLLIVVALGWVICQESLMGWYEQVTEVQETVTDNAVVLLLGAGLPLMALAAAGSRCEVVLVPAALVVVMFLIQNIMLAALLLVVAAYFAGIYYYRPGDGYGGGGFAGDWASAGGTGLGFYILLLLCLVLCAMFSDGGGAGGSQVCCWLRACSASTSSPAGKSGDMNTSEHLMHRLFLGH